MNRTLKMGTVIAVAILMTACAASRAFTRGERAARAGDWDAAVEYYRQAAQDHPDRAEYKIALERATYAAASAHGDRARKAESDGRLEEALREYRRASELDPTNRQMAFKASEMERTIRERLEAAQPRPQIERLREEARRTSPEPFLSPTAPLAPVRFENALSREVINFIGQSTGINVLFDRDFQDRAISINVDGVTLEQALQQIMVTNQLFYKVIDERTILVANDTTANRTRYEDQVVRTFFLSHADAQEMNQLLTAIIRIPGQAIQPQFSPNKTANTLTVRSSASVMQIIERMIDMNDKPRAEVMIDVQILEVSRERAKQFGLNLSQYAVGGIFSPERVPTSSTGGTTVEPFNLNTISQGVSTADFYLTIPSAVMQFLETDSRTKVLAKTQLRGAENQKVTLNLGEEVPVPSTTFTPLATGGAAANPLTSYGYRAIGVIVDMTPRVTYEGDIMLTLTLENSARLGDVNVGGTSAPAFSSRKVATTIRLRDGESNLLAGLLREDERRALRGFPGILRMPILQQLFGNTDSSIRQTDIVMLLTPRIIRTHELTARDVTPIYIGAQGNLSLGGGPPPLIGGGAPDAVPPPVAVIPPTTGTTPTPGTMQIPPGSSPIPGFTTLPPVVTPPVGTPVAPPGQPPPTLTFPPSSNPVPVDPVPVPPTAGTPPATVPSPAVQPAPAAGGGGRVSLSAPAQMIVGQGPYTVPVSLSGASRLSTISLSITFNPGVLRVRAVQEGTLMRQGGIVAMFTQQFDNTGGRVDIAITRPGDQTGVVGTGLLGAILFDAIAAGQSTISVTGVGTVVGGGTAVLQFAPVTVVVK